MAEPFLSEIKAVSFNFAPKGWALCNGQLLPINQNQALFSLMGTTYGGNGTTNFALPNLQGRTPLHFGSDPLGSFYVLGQAAGEVAVTLSVAEMPSHSHVAQGVLTAANSGSPAGNAWADSTSNPFGSAPDSVMNAASVTQLGGSQPHNNLPPYVTLNFIIALVGIFPSQN